MSTKKQRIEAAKLLGSAKSPAKAAAARRNAKLPRKKKMTHHEFEQYTGMKRSDLKSIKLPE